MPDPLADEKRALRAEIRQRRRSRGELAHAEDAERIADRLRELLDRTGARSLACYLSNDTEPGTRPFLNWAHEQGIRVLLPITREDGLLDWTVSDGVSERRHELGFPEAVGEVLGPIAVGEVDLILVPAAGVDRRGVRLGWGRGYYDKTLGSMERRPPVYAVVADADVFDELPAERHDAPVDGAVTPSAILDFPARSR